MASGTIYGTTSNDLIECKIVWSAIANEVNNESTVTATLYYRRTNEYTTYGTGHFFITIGDKTNNITQYLSIGSNWVKAISYTVTVPHDSNGIGWVTIESSGWMPDTTLTSSSCKGTVSLDMISRATTIDSLTRSSSSFSATLTYKYTPRSSYYTRANISLNLSGKYVAIKSVFHGKKTAGTQQTHAFTFSDSELSQIYENLPKTTTGLIRVTIRTYTDSDYSSEIGSFSYKEIALAIPASVKPTASLSISPVNSNTWIKEQGIYVAGYSGLSAAISATAGEGASMSSYSINGDNYSSDSSTLSVSKISKPGEIALTAKATDSRGRYATANKTITVQPYSIPAITSLSVVRGTYGSNWVADDDGPDVRVSFKTSLALTGFGNNYKTGFTLNNSTKAPDHGSTANLTSGTEYTVYFLNISNENSHTLKVSATDKVGSVGSATITIPTATITIEFNSSGKGIAFGKTSEKDAFECAMDAEFSGSLVKKRLDGSLMEIGDTGWIDIGTSEAVNAADASDTGRNGPGCYYRVINGNHVYVAFNVAFQFVEQAVRVNANAIPSKYRPARKAYDINLVSGRTVARVGVNTAGNVVIDWVQDLDTGATTAMAETTWIDGYIDYWV